MNARGPARTCTFKISSRHDDCAVLRFVKSEADMVKHTMSRNVDAEWSAALCGALYPHKGRTVLRCAACALIARERGGEQGNLFAKERTDKAAA